jgi:hypothetical protein
MKPARELLKGGRVSEKNSESFREQGRYVLKGALRQEQTTIAFGMTK